MSLHYHIRLAFTSGHFIESRRNAPPQCLSRLANAYSIASQFQADSDTVMLLGFQEIAVLQPPLVTEKHQPLVTGASGADEQGTDAPSL